MPTVVNVHEAKTQLSKLLRRVEAGEEIIIGRAGRPVARLTPFTSPDLPSRKPGGWEGQVVMADDFDALPDDVVEAFYGSRIDPESDGEAPAS